MRVRTKTTTVSESLRFRAILYSVIFHFRFIYFRFKHVKLAISEHFPVDDWKLQKKKQIREIAPCSFFRNTARIQTLFVFLFVRAR